MSYDKKTLRKEAVALSFLQSRFKARQEDLSYVYLTSKHQLEQESKVLQFLQNTCRSREGDVNLPSLHDDQDTGNDQDPGEGYRNQGYPREQYD